VALVNGLVLDRLAKFDQAPLAPPDRDGREMDQKIVAQVLDRSVRVPAPPPAVPTGRWSPAETVNQFLANESRLCDTLRTATNLRDHVVQHPLIGALDGYQWLLAAAAHTARHTKQILEVKADPQFPAR
jgi:hypothetical protein